MQCPAVEFHIGDQGGQPVILQVVIKKSQVRRNDILHFTDLQEGVGLFNGCFTLDLEIITQLKKRITRKQDLPLGPCMPIQDRLIRLCQKTDRTGSGVITE